MVYYIIPEPRMALTSLSTYLSNASEIYTCMYVCMYVYIYIYKKRERERERERLHVYTYKHVYIYIYIYIYIYMYVCMYIYIYIYTHMHSVCSFARRARRLSFLLSNGNMISYVYLQCCIIYISVTWFVICILGARRL